MRVILKVKNQITPKFLKYFTYFLKLLPNPTNLLPSVYHVSGLSLSGIKVT